MSLLGYTFCYDYMKSTHGGTGFFINEKNLFMNRRDVNISSDIDIESLILNQLLQKLIFLKKEFHLHMYL